MEKLIKYLWGLFLFIFPLSMRYIVYEDASYRFGNFNPWTTGFVYLPEVLLGVIFVMWFFYKLRIKNYELKIKSNWMWVLLFLFAINAYIVTLINGDSILGAIFILRLFEGLIIFWFVTEKILEPKRMITILLCGALFQIVWGYAQWISNSSLGLTFFGESVLGPDILGVAKNDLANGIKQIRAYGSFLHPNIFAGYLLVIFFLSLNYLKYASKFFWTAVFVFGIYLTNSRAAMIVGFTCIIIYFLFYQFKALPIRKTVALIILLILGLGNLWFFKSSYAVNTRDAAWKERLSQNTISYNMWKANPWGVGIGNFTLDMENFTDCGSNRGSDSGSNCLDRKLLPWEFQPVHNTYFLILNETGIQGLLILLSFLLALFDLYWRDGKAVPIFALLLLAPFDHLLWDSWVGLVLVAFVAGFFAIENHKEGIIERIEHAVYPSGDH